MPVCLPSGTTVQLWTKPTVFVAGSPRNFPKMTNVTASKHERLISFARSLLTFGSVTAHMTISLSLKMGRNIATTIPPMVTPRKLISRGSISEVRPSTVASTSSL